MSPIESILTDTGPARSSKIAELLQARTGISPENARQRLSRVGGKIFKFPVPLLPNRENFMYLQHQRSDESFWLNFQGALRETNSVYGAAIDGLIARGGIVHIDDFAVISGAPIALKGQVASERVAKVLESAGVLKQEEIQGEQWIVLRRTELGHTDINGYRSRAITEDIILDALRDWARKMGLASYNAITVRRDISSKRMIGAFRWDLTGPSYLFPLKGSLAAPGFLMADVFSDYTMDEFSISYIIRKMQLLKGSLKHSRFLPMLVADGFTGAALKKGRSEGILLATPETIFGQTVAKGLYNLLETLKNAAAIAAANPDRLLKLIEQLKDIEGAAKNLRGVLFELISAYIAKLQGGSIEIGVSAKDPGSGTTRDIDVLRIPHKGESVAIECKGKTPGGTVGVEEIEKWLKSIPICIAYFRNEYRFKDNVVKFEIWTSGTFHPDAIALLEKEKKARTKHPIAWKDGKEVFSISSKAKEKTINKALREHFLNHPLTATI